MQKEETDRAVEHTLQTKHPLTKYHASTSIDLLHGIYIQCLFIEELFQPESPNTSSKANALPCWCAAPGVAMAGIHLHATCDCDMCFSMLKNASMNELKVEALQLIIC